MVEDTSTSPVLTDANTCGPTNITYIKETTETEASYPLEGEDEASPRAILLAIRKMDFSMNARFNSLEASLSVVQLTLTTNTSCIADLEEASTDYERHISHLEQLCSGLSQENTSLKAKENQIFRVVLIEVDRAHRIGPIRNKPRVMIVRIHHDSVKIEILCLSRGQSPLSFDGGRISIFPDFPVEVSIQRKQFDSVLEKLRAKGIKYGLLYPGRLILTHEKMKKIYQLPHLQP
ncbi:putative transposase element L1Md-A101/L1Md-A102/L1Md-A2 [Labeo rohita]|uniref:Putative transposase element L1Md-A101/L1Md-A102/L1Md-A2 n=1 Tax=Labeo rohita TaxID=84645 RepID=A0A498LXL9_LABRO|nr:putative transposase element L1Md-A101/L1Md-A102/L1Md-A2 [Labeo rohita]RXN09937.1 putative transposase element L1Md-A101/L1Md-A102/L1Md-A2 [Labeo rohita]